MGAVDPALEPVADAEQELLEAARAGDNDAFGALVAAHRAELHAHCYRMLGSLHDAEDALQDALLRAWRGLARFEGRSTLRAWLYRIATNVCLTMLAGRPRRALAQERSSAQDPDAGPGEPTDDPIWLEPFPDEALHLVDRSTSPETRYEQRESVELAFVAALQHLPPRQRAALILRDVLGFSPAEIADALDLNPAQIYNALQRAHATVDQRLPNQSQQATLRSIDDQRLKRLVRRYVSAWESGDVDAILTLLTDDATIAMPPRPTWYAGRDAVGRFLATWPLSPGRRWRLVPTSANGHLAFGTYQWSASRSAYLPHAIDVLTIAADARISGVTAFLDARLLLLFGLPEEIAG